MGLVYVGANCDTCIIDCLPEEQLFIFVDSLPRTEYGEIRGKKTSKTFIPHLERELKKKGFIRSRHLPSLYKAEKRPMFKPKYFDPGVIVYMNGSKTLYYFYSTVYPHRSNYFLNQMLSMCDKLFVCGHEPEDNIVLRMQKPISFIGSTASCYTSDYDNYLFYQLANWCDETELLVSTFYSVDPNSKELIVRDKSFFF
jgi:hypothetical protein